MRADSIEFVLKSSFLSCEKDFETIIRKLFIDSKKYSDSLKSLLVVNTPDCLDKLSVYKKDLDKLSPADLVEQGYIRITPKLSQTDHGEVKSYIIISFNNFSQNSTNPEFRDCYVNIDVLCNTDQWELGDYRLRPLKICGYIDAVLNRARLSGIGQLLFAGCNELILDDTLSGYSLSYLAIHGTDDIIPDEDDE